jgi:hypothetical protein
MSSPVVRVNIGLRLPVTTPLMIEPTVLEAGTTTGRVTVEKPAVVVDVVLGADDAEASVGAYERW